MKKRVTLFSSLVLACISLPRLSRLWGKLMRLRRPRFLAKKMILNFKSHYRIEMDEYRGSPLDYKSLADFFVRPFDPGKKALPIDENFFLSPADGKISELELIHVDRASQVKGWTYPLSLLLGEEIDFAQGWHLATIYLSPSNYHRFHYPIAASVSGSFHGGSRLFPVNHFSVNRVKRLYIKNERVVTRFDLSNNRFYLVAVGATFVGSMAMEYLPAGLTPLGEWQALAVPVKQMDEMGRFNMGSTIILAIPAGCVEKVLAEKGKAVRVGDRLFKIKN
jgi:phosphatidylserine decarboxylase